jgi:hypothetical protein
MATFTTMLPELLEPWVTKIFFKEYLQIDLLYPQLFNVKKSTKAFEDTFKVSGLGTFASKAEGTPISYDDPVQSGRKRVVMITFALGFRVTMEMQEDDQHSIISQLPADLGGSARDHQENLAWGLLNDAFNLTGAYLGIPEGDAVRRNLCSTSHVALKSGSTQSNALNPGVALSVAGIEAAVTAFELSQDEQDRYIRIEPEMLVIHPSERFNAVRFLNSQQEPNTSNNAVNPINNLGINVLRVPFLTTTANWFLFAKKSQHSLTWYNRMELTMSRNKDSQTKDSLFDAMYRAQITFDDWRGVVGSAP